MKILVLGAGGMMGHMALRYLGRNHDVVGTLRGAPASHPVLRFADSDRLVGGVDTGRIDRVVEVIGDVQPDAVVNCVGIVKQLAAAKDAIASIECNSLLPHRLAAVCAENDARLVHLSTDCVFSGRKGDYTEEDLPDPVDLYGRSKLLGELGPDEGLTIRTSIVGRQLTGTTSLFEWVLANRGRTVKGFRRAIYSGVTTAELARIMDLVLREHPELTGVWQVASDPINKYELVSRLNDRLNLGMTVEPDDEFVLDRSLDGSAFVRATGVATRTWDEMLDEFARDEQNYEELGTR